HVGGADLPDPAVAQLREVTSRHGIELSGLGYYPNPLAPDRAEAEVYVEHLRRVILVAERLGIGVVNTFVGRDWTKSIDDNWPRFRETWPPLIAFAEQHGVRIGIENCPMLFTGDEWPGGKNLAISPAVWRRMFAEIPSSSWGLNYDPSHMIWQHMDPLAPIRVFADRLVARHAKDGPPAGPRGGNAASRRRRDDRAGPDDGAGRGPDDRAGRGSDDRAGRGRDDRAGRGRDQASRAGEASRGCAGDRRRPGQ